MNQSPLGPRRHFEPSVFHPENLLREARRQRGRPDGPVPAFCVLDPDGDLVRALRDAGRCHEVAEWACYHTAMVATALPCGVEIGIVGCAVGGPFAVLVAEQIFAAGGRILVSITSAGRIAAVAEPPYFILLDRALRDEGTSGNYLPTEPYAAADPALAHAAAAVLDAAGFGFIRGCSWTTDAPYRETEAAIAAAERAGILAVEMEAASLYAFATARARSVLCFAHVTNQMARTEGDFEKGAQDGAAEVLALLDALARAGLGLP